MFGKKKVMTTAGGGATMMAPVIVIPDAFYGGADPVIHYASELAKERVLSHLDVSAPKKAPVRNMPAAAPAWMKNKKILFVGGGVAFFLFIGLAAWYYIRQGQGPARPIAPRVAPSSPVIVPSLPAPTTTIETPTLASTPLAPSSTLQRAPTSPSSSLRDHLGEWTRINTLDTADLDADQLTDAEEEVFGTDPSIWDTDNDGYFDGQEVVNLYNPKGFAPVKIIDSGLVREYANPMWQYRLFYPEAWESASVDAHSDQVIFSAQSGDFVEVHAFRMNPGETFQAWFARTVATQQFTDLIETTNRFGVDFWKRKDSLVGYVPSDGSVFVMIYHPALDEAVRYRHIMMMMMQSMRPSGNTADIPAQPPIPAP